MTLAIRDVSVVPEGDGVDVKRLFPLRGFMNFDPFVLWDHFNIGPGHGFPDHPHRGFEAITYMFEGGMNHKDNIGNASFVTPGGAQRFTAGKGLVHSEMPADKGDSNGIQLWINLSQALKQIEPDYQQVDNNDFPVVTFEGGSAKIIVGENSPLKLKTDVIYQHVQLDKNAKYIVDIKSGMRGIIYILNGKISANDKLASADQALFIENIDKLKITASANSEFMLCMGRPHGEPIRQHGPFVD